MKIAAVFSDYDGTLAADDTTLEGSRVPKDVQGPLLALSSSVPVAIVTSKDAWFVRPRTPFAAAWACVSGLDIVLPDGRALISSRGEGRLREGLTHIMRRWPGRALELKRSSAKDLLGFSVDWRRAPPPSAESLRAVTADLTAMGLSVAHDPTQPFLDVFGARPDKGRAVRELRRLLNVDGSVLFLGDSTADNPAFEEADVGVCVAHGQSLDGLSCPFAVGREEVGPLLQSLVDGGLSLDTRTLARQP